MSQENHQVDRIKELLISKNYEIRETGLELARSLDNPIIYDKLLETWNQDGNIELQISYNYSGFATPLRELIGSGKLPAFNNYILCSLLIGASLSSFYIGYKPSSIKKLNLQGCAIKNLDFLSNMPSLTELEIDDFHLDNLDGWSYLSNLINLTNLIIISSLMTNVDFLKNLTKIEAFEFRGGDNLENMDAMTNLINLTYLHLYETPFNLIWYNEEETGDPEDAEVEEIGLAGDQLATWFAYMFKDSHERSYKGKSTYNEAGNEVLEDGTCGEVAGFRHELYPEYYPNVV